MGFLAAGEKRFVLEPSIQLGDIDVEHPLSTEFIPVSFEGHAGVLHRPTSKPRLGVTVVICPPAGRDARCAYRPMFLWAEDLARRGFQVLRYDNLGEGDSLGLEPEADQWDAWLGGVHAAAAFARAYTGAQQLVLCGVRAGGALALAAAESVKPDGVMLLSPTPSGAAWLRDLRFAAAIQRAPATTDGSIEVDGVRLSAATIQSLQSVDVTKTPRVWRDAFMAAPPSGAALAATLGPDATVRPFEGHAAFFKEPHVNEQPTRVLEEAAEWLEYFAAGAPRPKKAPALAPAVLEQGGWRERPVAFGDGLRGVLCLPSNGGGARAVLIGNTAGDPRAGIGGFAAQACRTLAKAGVAALRFDFRGVGESASGEAWRSHPYDTPRLPDFRAAAELVRAHGYSEITLLGVCTGGYHAIQAVLDDPQFDRAIAINSWLVWRPERMPLQMRSEMALNGADPLKPPAPPPAKDGLTPRVARKLQGLVSSTIPDAPCRKVRARLQAAARRGVRVHLILGRGDASTRSLEAEFGLECGWIARQRGFTVSMRRDIDHALFSPQSQRNAMGDILRALELAPAAHRLPKSA
ncbi:alpha/beta fold hydrolase [Phenylobacterium deserti]|uniref:Serine aminopeptidase S33 domain-containing protein n=1 Tax=Phenylobacterium deserti TaxID=1914756 RepID=A0A328ADT7_9CAUL|nr:alpha/beta fold hydrolase [Phenylobacterium deserti]RAK52386.1 hypothetical protein DJ018_14760 [Phenylobacterium deserti]